MIFSIMLRELSVQPLGEGAKLLARALERVIVRLLLRLPSDGALSLLLGCGLHRRLPAPSWLPLFPVARVRWEAGDRVPSKDADAGH